MFNFLEIQKRHQYSSTITTLHYYYSLFCEIWETKVLYGILKNSSAIFTKIKPYLLISVKFISGFLLADTTHLYHLWTKCSVIPFIFAYSMLQNAINWKATLEFTLALFTEAPKYLCVQSCKEFFCTCIRKLHGTDRHFELKPSACHLAAWLWNGSPKSFPECPITRQNYLPSCL